MAVTWASPGTLFLKWEMDEPLSARAKVVYANYLDGLGFPENAVEHMDRAIAMRPDALGLHLNKLELICRTGIEGDLLQLFESAKKAKVFDFGVTNQVERLIGLAGDQGYFECKSGTQPFTVVDLFEIAENARAREWNAKRAARFFSLKSDYYASVGNLDSAVTAVEAAAIYQPSVDLFLKASVMLASAGLYDDALERLAKAREADEGRRMFYPSRIDELNGLEYAIKALM
uniref:Tetratricopeptide repeat protein n=1 Tax=Marinobacter nauticus TaxID=2743 RepID=A0A455WEH9_MARNT|nr:hypothetical protein YBY_25020 [Marinobacter nauticus]